MEVTAAIDSMDDLESKVGVGVRGDVQGSEMVVSDRWQGSALPTESFELPA